MRLTEQALIERKEKIIYTAYELFCEFGIDGITLSQIAKRANVGDSAIYRYFDSKANLLRHAQKILWEEIVKQIDFDVQTEILSAQNGLEEISVRLYGFKSLYEKHSNYLLFANDYKSYLVRNNITLGTEEYNQLLRPAFKTFKAALRRGHEDGTISCKENVEEQFFAIWGIMRGFVEQAAVYEKIYGTNVNHASHFELVYRYVINGLTA